MNTRATLIATLSAVVCGLSSFSALAQWQWLDETGRKTYSDRPPPAHIPDKNVLKRPATASARPVALPKAELPEEEAQQAQAAEANALQPAQPAPPSAEELKRQKEEAAKKAAEEAQQAQERTRLIQQRQENCNRAQAALRTLQSDVPLAQVGADGQHTTMSDAQRQQDIQRAQSVIARDCGPVPDDL